MTFVNGGRHFAALVDPRRVHLIEFRPERRGMHVIGQWSDDGPFTTANAAADRVATLLSALGPRRAALSVAVSHFGSFHQGLTLPSADNEVLRPIVRREMQRLYGMDDIAFAFASAAPQTKPAGAQTQLSVVGAPVSVVNAIMDRLSSRQVEVQCITVAAQAITALFRATRTSAETAATVVCLQSGPQVMFFLPDETALAIEPPPLAHDDIMDVKSIVDQVERGAIYLRQQFRGAQASQVYLGAPPEMYEALSLSLTQRVGVTVEEFAGGTHGPETVVALGAAVEAQNGTSLDLRPTLDADNRRVKSGLAIKRQPPMVVAASVIAAFATMWAAWSVVSVYRTREDIAGLQRQITSDTPALTTARAAVLERAGHARAMQTAIDAQRNRVSLVQALSAIARSVPPSIQLDSVSLQVKPEGWHARLLGRSAGGTSSAALQSVEELYRRVPTRVVATDLAIDPLDYTPAAPGQAGVEVRFGMSFVVPAGGRR